MQGFCDSCEESADHLFDLTRLPEFNDVVHRLNYRKVCQVCYDDLYDEIRQQEDRSDRRSHARYPLKIRINISGIDREGQKFSEETFTQDVSLSGARISINHLVESGSVLKLTIPEAGIEAVVIIELIWQDGNSKSAGLKLVEANDSWYKLITEQAVVVTN